MFLRTSTIPAPPPTLAATPSSSPPVHYHTPSYTALSSQPPITTSPAPLPTAAHPKKQVRKESTTAMEDVLRGTGAKDSAPKRPQQLQAGGTNIPPDEDPGAARPKTPRPPGGTIDGPAAVHLSAWHRGGWRRNLSATQLFLIWRSLGALWGSCSLISPVISTPFNRGTNWSTMEWICTLHPGYWTTLPTDPSIWGSETVCRTWLSAVRGPCRERSWLHSSSPSALQTSPTTHPPVTCRSSLMSLRLSASS